jgi:CO/xanthine dehydrogenase Mo-binding subunit
MLELNRRAFLQSLGGGLLILSEAGAQESGRGGGRERLPENVGAWLHIARDGSVTGFTGKVEVGQNIRTSLTQAVADELRCAPRMVNLVMGDTSLVPWDAGTFGSRTTPTMAPVMRKMAATAREALLDQAAKVWSVDRGGLTVVNGCVLQSSASKKIGFGELAAKLDWVGVVGRDGFATPATQWQAAGTSLPKVNARELVSGRHKYTSDHKLPGMLYGRVLRPPSFEAKLRSVDTTRASKMAGVTVIRDGDFVGVAATDEHKAGKALDSIEAKWDEQPHPVGAREIFSYLAKDAPPSAETAYTISYIAHVPLEPRAAVAEWKNGKLTVWTGTQRPFGVRQDLASALGLPEQQIRVIMPDTGSAYGGKHSGECAIEAAKLAKGAGKAVKLIWTREEEFTWAYFRPAGVIRIGSSIADDGTLRSWEFHNYLSGPSGLTTPYEVASKNEHFHKLDSPLREGSYRGLASTANHFARESHMDELAARLHMDPLAFRLKNLKNERVIAVLQAAADRFEWSKHRSTPERGFGLACGTEKGGYVGCCAEISVRGARDIHIERVVTAWESGAIVNPEHLKNQIEGAVVMGLGGALFEAIDFSGGRIHNPHLSKYRVPRFSDAPKIEVVLLDRKDLPSAGAGETPIVGIAPAVANAIYSATQVRVRSLPMLPSLSA